MKIFLIALSFFGSYLSSFAQNTFPDNGNVGIGTLSPSNKLDIIGGINTSDNSIINGIGFTIENTYYKQIKAVGFNLLVATGAGDAHFLLPFNSDSYAQFYNLGLIIEKNLGVGTTSPIGKLDIRGNAFIGTNDLVIGSTGSFVQIDQGTGSGNTYSQIRAFSNGGSVLNNLVLQNGGGNVGIGTADPKGYKLAVNGKIRTQEIKVENANWPDYVFDKSYQLPTLQETERHIKEKGHLPGIPSAVEVRANGIDLGEMNAKLLQKIEEVTLHLIELEKKNELQQKEIDNLKLKCKNL